MPTRRFLRALVHARTVNRAAPDLDRPGVRRIKPGNHAQGRGLAAPAGTQQARDLAALHAKVDVGDSLRLLKRFSQSRQSQSIVSGNRFAGYILLTVIR